MDTEQDVNTEEVDSVITLEEAKTSLKNLFKFYESKRAFEDNKFFTDFNSIEKKLESSNSFHWTLYFSN